MVKSSFKRVGAQHSLSYPWCIEALTRIGMRRLIKRMHSYGFRLNQVDDPCTRKDEVLARARQV